MGGKGVFLTDRSADCSRIYLGKVLFLVASSCPLSPLPSSPLSVIMCISYPTPHTDTRTGGESNTGSLGGSSMQYQPRHLDILFMMIKARGGSAYDRIGYLHKVHPTRKHLLPSSSSDANS